jgi:hypothetical protein
MAYKVVGFDIIDDTRRVINASTVGIGTTLATNLTTKLFVIGDSITTGIVTGSQFTSTVAQGTAPISVASSTLVSNLNAQYLNGQSGAYYNSANNLTGTAPGGVISQSNGLTITGNLSVSGNVSVSGTSFLLNATQLRINDRDITLGVTTDVNGNDVSTDVTANHGGIAIASTEGSPILNIPPQVGVNTDPSTYKQLMWIKQGNYSGMGTDAWVFNYAVSVGNTASVQNLSRLTVGAGFTVFDTYLDATDIRARNISAVNNINASGIITSGTHNVTTGNTYQINGTSVLSNNTLGSGVVNSSLTSVGTLSFLNVGNVNSTGIITATSFKGDGSQITGITVSGIGAIAGVTVRDEGNTVGTAGSVTSLNFIGGNIVATASGIAATITISDNLVGTALSITGISTFTGITTVSGSFFSNQASISGVTTSGGVNVTSGNDYKINATSVLTSTTLGSAVVNSSLTSVGTLGILQVTGVTTSGGVNVTSGNDYKINGTSVLTSTTLGSAVVNSSLTSVGTLSFLNVGNINSTGIGTIPTLNSTTGTITNLSGTNLNYTGISTITSIATNTNINSSGIHTAAQYYVGATKIHDTVNSQITLSGIATIDATTRATLERELAFAPNDFNTLNVSGISTLSQTTIIGGGTSTGTSNQVLQVSGISSGAYIGGSLGIGVTLPTQPLDVSGNVRFRGGIYDSNNVAGAASSVLTANGSGGWSWQPVTGTGAITGITITDDNSGIKYPLFTSVTSGSVTGQFVDSTALVYNTATNCLGIGSLTPTSRLDIIGDVKVVGIITATDFNSSSDRNLKDNIQVIPNAIEKVLQLNGVSFNWKSTGYASMGVIAQEVELVMPELVSDTDPKSVNYNGLIGLLIECVKDQQRQIDELKNK